MRLSYQELLDYDIPEVRQRYSQRDSILYALSVGVAQNPLDELGLHYVDEQYGPHVLPSMAVVLGYPGFWLRTPGIDADVTRLLHGEQSVTLLAAIPAEGEVIGKTRVVEAVDKGEKGLLLYSEKELRDAGTGQLLATTAATHVLRGDGGMAGAPTQARMVEPFPDSLPQASCTISTRTDQALLYRQNGDRNPLHSDPAVAKKAGYERPILHGLCTFAMVNHAVSRTLGKSSEGDFDSVFMRFSAPVFPGEQLRVDVWGDGAFRATALERNVVVMQGRQRNR
ncbi:3-alpha,7-alpha,12-alpha-trihydroxy-5-beta-cholest-24-enoyl-CoA hydratase (plasmid) [Diaphorobacter sp. HDW4B]|uniref:MaoC/PaaZ C-terminal domain-containing protein n=1 Tax=Diaphorobacter sp. HDW4B TaxID=2714925 RepID=UPI00140D943C|nr:MaoC/PaaZ C-terminal domain-containing protein [Diaphorobacter sp. HDW4B]QIL74167.1 3-alpha,7-alpha,12-alpha-trihydroxy-5-beta-cholest-24-enoyl-CoA hydratase [Diaphorobacter sp. HDW4B]